MLKPEYGEYSYWQVTVGQKVEEALQWDDVVNYLATTAMEAELIMVERKNGWFARAEALFGPEEWTDWLGPFRDEKQARDELAVQFEVCPETGIPLNDKPAHVCDHCVAYAEVTDEQRAKDEEDRNYIEELERKFG